MIFNLFSYVVRSVLVMLFMLISLSDKVLLCLCFYNMILTFPNAAVNAFPMMKPRSVNAPVNARTNITVVAIKITAMLFAYVLKTLGLCMAALASSLMS